MPYLFTEDSSYLVEGLKEALDGLESVDVSDRGLKSETSTDDGILLVTRTYFSAKMNSSLLKFDRYSINQI